MEHIAAAQRSNPGAAVCYYSAFRLHSNKRHAHRLQKPESGAWLPRTALQMQGNTSRDSGRLNCYSGFTMLQKSVDVILKKK